jgi:uncharacterized membrane protein YqjE
MTDRAPIESPGLLGSLSNAMSNMVEMAHVRLELLSVDIEEDRDHFLFVLAAGLGAFFLFGVGVLLLAICVVAVFWETHRLMALGGLSVVFLLAGGVAASIAWKRSMMKPRLFASSLAELAKDLQLLRPRA